MPIRPQIRVALVDHRPLSRHGLELLLRQVSDGQAEVVASTGDASEAGALVRRCRPDLVLVDLDLPRPGGVHAIVAVRRAAPRTRTIAMAGGDDPESAVAALRAGASGLVPRTSEAATMMQPLLAVLDGWTVVPSSLIGSLIDAVPTRRAAPSGLDAADRALLQLISSGATTAEIGVDLHVSDRTVKRMTAALLRKLRVSSRTEAAAVAGSAGLV